MISKLIADIKRTSLSLFQLLVFGVLLIASFVSFAKPSEWKKLEVKYKKVIIKKLWGLHFKGLVLPRITNLDKLF